jgi:broad specificity phosphatase PhoE
MTQSLLLSLLSGESYIDCCNRVIPILEQMETSPEPLLIVAHQAILRCVVTYLLKGDLGKLPNVKIPQHCLLRVTYVNGENVIDYIRTPVDHSEQGIIKSLFEDSKVDCCQKNLQQISV